MVPRTAAFKVNKMWMESARHQQTRVEAVPRSARVCQTRLPFATMHAEEGRLRVLDQPAHGSREQERRWVAACRKPRFVHKIFAAPHEPEGQPGRKLVNCILELFTGKLNP